MEVDTPSSPQCHRLKIVIAYFGDGSCPPFDLIKAGATQTETSLLKQYVAGECADLLDEQ